MNREVEKLTSPETEKESAIRIARDLQDSALNRLSDVFGDKRLAERLALFEKKNQVKPGATERTYKPMRETIIGAINRGEIERPDEISPWQMITPYNDSRDFPNYDAVIGSLRAERNMNNSNPEIATIFFKHQALLRLVGPELHEGNKAITNPVIDAFRKRDEERTKQARIAAEEAEAKEQATRLAREKEEAIKLAGEIAKIKKEPRTANRGWIEITGLDGKKGVILITKRKRRNGEMQWVVSEQAGNILGMGDSFPVNSKNFPRNLEWLKEQLKGKFIEHGEENLNELYYTDEDKDKKEK